ncbi:MFS transporter [Hanamia caeni]|jgi:MFS family permease|uniref:MFS transporter n=1 Tax=Hanamia caeni TaxID=2294116 RepID=UPI0018F355A2|nr:MFS transporter [Hanamia caeni]
MHLKSDPFASVKVVEYRNLIIGRFGFIMGLRMMSTLIGWWIYLLTNDPFAIGLVGLSEVIPALSLALYAGHVIDQSEKRRLLLKGVMLYFLASLCLVFISTKFTSSHLSKHGVAVCIYFVIFCTGIFRAFTGPVFSAVIAYIVPRNDLQNATTWSQGTWLSASVTGHATGGFLIAVAGITNTLVVICGLIAVSFIFLFKLKPKPAATVKGAVRTWESVKEGLRFVYKTKELFSSLSLDLFAVLFGGAVALIPIYARDILKVGSEGFGILNGAADLGSILIVIILTLFPAKKNQGKKFILAVGGFGLCIIVFGISKIFLVSFFALMISGMLDGISVVVRGTIMQLKTPDFMRGRVMSVNSMFVNSSNELGQFESGITAKLMGTVPAVVFGGSMTLLVVIYTWFKSPTLRKMQY